MPAGTGWVAPALPDWRADTPSGGQFLWNIAANLATQTARFRTGPARVTVVDKDNNPVSGVTVTISQLDHAFPIGCTFNPGMIIDAPDCSDTSYADLAFTHFDGGGGDSGAISASERAQIRTLYKTIGLNYWKNESGFLEALWESVFHTDRGYLGEAKGPTIVAMDWMKNKTGKLWRGFDGHSLHYPIDAIYPNPPYGTTVTQHSDYWRLTHLPDIIANNGGITKWSLVNEVPDSWYTTSPKYQDPLLISNLATARALTTVPVYVNGYTGGVEINTQAEYYEAQGIHVDEVAQQWHRYSGVTTQQGFCDETKALNFKADGTTVSPRTFNISEYDSTFSDFTDRATDFERAVRACFANPGCSSFCCFGMWEPTHWLSAKWGFVKRDMTFSTVGQKFRDLFFSEWWTGIVASTTGAGGYHDFTGNYFGGYDVTVSNGTSSATKRFEVAPSMAEIVATVSDAGVLSFSPQPTMSKIDLAQITAMGANFAAYAAGTAYSLTNTSAALSFGTTQPSITITTAGTYLIMAAYNAKYNGATFAAARTVTMKLRRTNNTAADLTNGSRVSLTNIITALTYTFDVATLAPVIYTTANTDDVLTIFGDVSVVPSAGSLDIVEASIFALRIS